MIVRVEAAAETSPAAAASSVTQTSKNTFTIRGAQAEQLKATIYNTQNRQKQNHGTLHNPPVILAEDIPIADQDQKWKSLNEDVEFIPAEGIDPQILRRFLEQNDEEDEAAEYYATEEEEDSGSGGASSKMKSIYNIESFAYGGEEYDEYQQAWRQLGFIIDCHPMVDDDYYANEGGSGDQGTEDGCARYVLWAAYVDLDYQGSGIGEYQYWDRFNNQWDTSACDAVGSSRCAKMDCHLENTHFALLGFFKHKSYDDWMEQLFKHEGICVWTDEEYAFMQGAREAWPQGCIDSYSALSDGTEIYYDIKPLQGGDITVGLYTDTQCIKEYDGSDGDINVENLLGNFFLENDGSGDQDYNYDFSSDTLEESLARWDSAFGAFHTCQPCVAYDLENTDGTKYYDDDGGNGQGGVFDCYDDADYTNVNQCMKFMAKTTMNTATFRDMSMGRYQGTLVSTPLAGFDGKQSWRMESFSNKLTYFFLCIAAVIFAYGMIYFIRVKKATNYKPTFGWNVKEPLVFT
ncbi:MAG: hypothetical protein SGILL_004194 [Bacillariaceae sp.]